MTENVIQHPHLRAALVAAQAEFGFVSKDTQNPFFKSKYADLPAVMREAQPVLAKHGLGVSQEPSFVLLDGKVYDTLKTTVFHNGESSFSDSITSEMILKPVKNDPQAQGSAITYARRYAYMSVLGLVADNDDDGNAASGNSRKPAASRARPATKGANSDQGELASPEVSAAIQRVKAAVKTAGKTGKDAQVVFEEQFPNGGALTASTDIDALTAVAVIFETAASDGDN